MNILFLKKSYLLTWKKSNCKVNYRVLFDIFCIINDTEKPLSPKDNLVPCLNLICKNDVTDIVGKPSNFMRNELNKINNKKKTIGLDDVVPEFGIASQDQGQLNYGIDTQNFLGKYCEKINIDKTIFNQIADATGSPLAKALLTNGALLETERERGGKEEFIFKRTFFNYFKYELH